MIEKLTQSCVNDMCQFQLNSLQQQKSKCDNYERLSQACYDIGITNFEWRTKANCRKIREILFHFISIIFLNFKRHLVPSMKVTILANVVIKAV